MTAPSDLPIRLAAFRWLEEQAAAHGEVLAWSVLIRGFPFEGERVPLVSMQGIFKPSVCRLPLSIRTTVGGPYAVDPDDRIVVRQDVLDEEDGPMLRHGLQELHHAAILVPSRASNRPDRDLLAWRLEQFGAR